uniref:Putative methyltransferase n=1 Tax=viral metagenome TaxID=1070528 RepID=A0A6M3KYT1_9ZZZZ
MAFSAGEGKRFFKDWLIHFAQPLKFNRFLDIGCGAGIYGDIIREVFNQEAHIDAVEAWSQYIVRHDLKKKYDRIIMEDIVKVWHQMEDYDVIVMGDVIEHLTKHDAIMVICGLKAKCRFLWGSLPIEVGRPWSTGYRQGKEEWVENKYNQHLHDWTGNELKEIFNPMWIVPYVQTGVFLIEGVIR